MKSLICANADAIGYMYRKGSKAILSFKNTDDVTCGARPKHLRDQEIVLTEMNEEVLEDNWDKIFV